MVKMLFDKLKLLFLWNTKHKAEYLYKMAMKLWKKDDFNGSIKLFKESAKLGYVKAQANLGWLYVTDVLGKDFKESAKWYLEAAKQGDAESQDEWLPEAQRHCGEGNYPSSSGSIAF